MQEFFLQGLGQGVEIEIVDLVADEVVAVDVFLQLGQQRVEFGADGFDVDLVQGGEIRRVETRVQQRIGAGDLGRFIDGLRAHGMVSPQPYPAQLSTGAKLTSYNSVI